MKLMILQNRRIVAGPNETQSGYLVCVFQGCSMPVVKKSERENKCSLVGKSYLCEYMNGGLTQQLLDGECILRSYFSIEQRSTVNQEGRVRFRFSGLFSLLAFQKVEPT